MPFRYYSPGSSVFALLIAGVLKLFKTPKKRRHTAGQKSEPYVSNVQRVLAAHADCTAELFNIFVKGNKRVAPFSRLVPGDRMEMTADGERIAFFAHDIQVAEAELPESSLIPRAFREGRDPEVFLGGRDVRNASDEAEFATLVVFYKIEGVPPTKIQIK